MKINFTKQHYQDLVNLVAQAAMSHTVISTKMGQPLDIVALLHTTTINTLNDIKASLVKRIRSIEDRDEWVDADTVVLDTLKGQKELVNLIVGWKRWKMEIDETRKKKENLTKKLAELKESTKTPQDRIKDIETELAALDAEEDFK